MRIPRLAAMLAVAVSAVAVAAGCSSGSPNRHSKGSVIPVLTEGASSFSSLNIYTASAVGPFTPMFESLLSEGANGQLEPWLATSWSQPGPKTYIFHLRHGVKFWNGDPMTSADVVTSFEWENKPTSLFSTVFKGWTFTARGPYTVVVRLPKPTAGVLVNLGFLYIFQAKFMNKVGNSFGRPGAGGEPGGVMATGPWEVQSFDPTSGLVLTANPHYWHGKVNIKRINIDFFSSPESEALAMRTGEVDVAPLISDPAAFEHIPGVKLIGSTGCSENAVAMNTLIAPYNNIHVRLAVASALNRADIIDAWGGFATPLYTWIPQTALTYLAGGDTTAITNFVHSLPSYKYADNLQYAKQQMSMSPYPHGFSTTLQLTSYGYYRMEQVGQVIANELKPLGIKVNLKTVSLAVSDSSETAVPAQKPAMVMDNYGCGTLDPATEQQVTEIGSANAVKGGYNVSNWGPPKADKLLAEGNDSTRSNGQRLRIYEALSRELAADAPIVPLSEQGNIVAISDKYKWPSYRSWYTSENGSAFLLGIEPAG